MFNDFLLAIKRFGFEYYGLWYGVYRATVSQLDDSNKGRLKVIVPATGNKSQPLSGWAYPAFMTAGNQKGWYSLPSIGDTVWVMFENGKLEFPLWFGGWYADSELPPQFQDKQDLSTGFVTKAGHRVIVDDQEGFIELVCSDDGETHVRLDTNSTVELLNNKQDTVRVEDGVVTISTNSGDKIIVDQDGINITSSGGDVVTVGQQQITINARTSIAISSSAKIDINSGLINVNGKIEPMVLGNKLYSYLLKLFTWTLTHTHVCTLPGTPSAPPIPSPPLPPMSILSLKSKVG